MKVGDTFKEIESIDLRHTADGYHKELLHKLHVRTRVFNKHAELPMNKCIAFEIPKAFRTDGASIPKILWWWTSPMAWRVLLPAIAHDKLWRDRFITGYVLNMETMKIEKKIGIMLVTYKQGNRIMLEKLASFRCNVVNRYLIFFALEIVRVLTKGK